MNLVFDYLDGLMTGAEQRMDAAGVPKIVPDRCFVCKGAGAVEHKTAFGIDVTYCASCASRGYVLREAA